MCSHCNKLCDAKKRFSIEQSPRTLIIHLKRFDNQGRKIKNRVQFPKTFSLKSFKSESIDRIAKGLPALEWADLHKANSSTSSSSNGSSQIISDLEVFDLQSFVVHQGY